MTSSRYGDELLKRGERSKMEDVALSELPEDLKPIKPNDWKEACNWIKLRWGRCAWEDDVALWEDAKFFCARELWGGLNALLSKGSEFPPNFAELTKAIGEYRQHHLQNDLNEYQRKQLGSPKGSLKDYLNQIQAESFRHACYMKTQDRAKKGQLLKYEDSEAYDQWTMDWSKAKETYMVSLKSIGQADSISQKSDFWDEL